MSKKDLAVILVLGVSNFVWLIPTEWVGRPAINLVIVTIVGFIGWLLAIGIFYLIALFLLGKIIHKESRVLAFEISLIVYLVISLAILKF